MTDEAGEAQAFLAALDDPIARLAREHGRVAVTLPSHGVVLPDPLERLTLTIVGQRISVKAALVIFGRLRELLGGRVDAAGLARIDERGLRQVGLTRAKAQALRELGAELVGGSFSFDALASLSDPEAEARLVALRGVGSWSAQMFLLRGMARPDVFPAGDLGLRRGIESLYTLPELPGIPAAAERALAWRPYRSYAAKYLWLHYAAAAET
ncbi:MAG: DNA-3-methyladenine glycosylase 2 family protein [Acidobacteriota bacterium]|nr:DNA-3-methyladenine glycosylase 2 family protein [Acidobacteriota bacterium]